MKLIIVALLMLAVTVSGSFFDEVDPKQHLEKFFMDRYPIEKNNAVRETTREYIKDKFSDYGLEVQEQTFSTTINTDPKGIANDIVTVFGTNIIGIKKAITKQADAVVVVGADYDSDGLSDPLFYNGAGVAALLEVARTYCSNTNPKSERFTDNFTTIFVAFDINTKHYKGSSGRPGGVHFVNEWLWPYIERNSSHFGGAVILDSIMNVHYENETQILGPDIKKSFPKMYKRVVDSGFKGDFLAMVSHGRFDEAIKLKDQFSSFYNEGQRYRLEDMVVLNGNELDSMTKLFTKSDNIHFWSFKDDTENFVPLPAILLTDTARLFRSDPGDACPTCRPVDLLTEERLEFVSATVRATTRFLLDRQATRLSPQESNAVSSLPSILTTALMMCLVLLYM